MLWWKNTTVLACLIIANPILAIPEKMGSEQTLADYVSHKYLSSMSDEKQSITPSPSTNNESSWFVEKLKQKLTSIAPQRQTLTPRETQKIAFDLIATSTSFKTNIVDRTCIDKLEIIAGGENAQQVLLERIFTNINTSIGKAYSALSLCHPTTDIALLKNRQKAIATLSTNSSFVNLATVSLKAIGLSENKSLLPWNATSPINTDMLKSFYFGSSLEALNSKTIPLEMYNKLWSLLIITKGLIAVPLIKVVLTSLQYNLDFTTATQQIIDRITSSQIPLSTKLLENFDLFFQIVTIYSAIMSLKNTGTIVNHLQEGLIATASHIEELKKLSSSISQNKELLMHLPSLEPLANFNNPAKHSEKLNKLLDMLDTNTFNGDASFFSSTGRVLAAYELMKQVKDELAPIFAAAGELDMYLALAKLYNSRDKKETRYCMVEFVENSATPMIKAHNFWNPFINPNTVVVNDIAFDSSCRNIILSGPNTSGKSTVIKAIMLNVLIAQVFGIAPSESLTITAFTKLNCFMNISDDIAAGASLFTSEVIRAKKILDLVQSLKKDEFSFVIIDEIFTGTSPQEGEKAALQFAEKIGTYSNNISIIATHYPKMTDLPTTTNGIYSNYHVEILRNKDGSLNRTFKLKKGPSFFNVALDILEEEGLFVK